MQNGSGGRAELQETVIVGLSGSENGQGGVVGTIGLGDCVLVTGSSAIGGSVVASPAKKVNRLSSIHPGMFFVCISALSILFSN